MHGVGKNTKNCSFIGGTYGVLLRYFLLLLFHKVLVQRPSCLEKGRRGGMYVVL